MTTGLTKDAGYEIGVSKTLPYASEAVWALLAGAAGIALWLGPGAELRPEKGWPYRTADGTAGAVRSFHEGTRMRLSYRPAGWDHDSILQVTVTPGGKGTVLRFHQERLADAGERERQRTHWQQVMAEVERVLGEA